MVTPLRGVAGNGGSDGGPGVNFTRRWWEKNKMEII